MDNTRGRKLIKGILTLLFLVAGYIFYHYFVYHHDPAKILKDHSMTTGKIVTVDNGEENGGRELLTHTLYAYEVNGKRSERPTTGFRPCNYEEGHQRNEMLNYEYTVIYYNPDPEYSRLLIKPEHFEKFEKEFPGALNDIYNKYWNCD